MNTVIKIFNEIKNTSSINEKKSIILKNKDNELFKKCLVFLLDGNVVTGLSTKKINKNVQPSSEFAPYELCTFSSFEDVMNYLGTHNTGTDEDIYEVQAFLFGHKSDRDFYEQMITKKYKLGVDAKVVNSVIPDLIPHWEVQLGSSFDKLKLKKNEYFYLSKKLNGIRASCVNGEFISRQGKKISGMQHIQKEINQLSNGTNMFFDGELIRKNIDNISDNENFRIGTGIINSDAPTKEEIKFVIFDCFSKDELKNGKSKDKYSKRKEQLLAYKNEIDTKYLTSVEIVPMVYEGTDTTQIMKWLDYAVEHDWEGLMLNKNTFYECKRTTNLIKIKRFYSMDLEVIDVVEGAGRLKGTLGALIVKYKDNTVNVGSGFDDETRKKLWENREDIIGRVVEVKYKEISKDKKTGMESLQFPIFMGIRETGKTVSYD